MKKILTIAAIAAIVSAAAFAGLDVFTGKNYIRIIAPQEIGVTYPTNGAAATTVSTVTNVPISLAGYPGIGALVLSVNCGDSTGGVIVATVRVATNSGTVGSWTNSASADSTAQLTSGTNAWTFTGVQTQQVTRFNPNAEIGRVQIRFVATGVTNGSVAALLVTE